MALLRVIAAKWDFEKILDKIWNWNGILKYKKRKRVVLIISMLADKMFVFLAW